MTAEQKLRRYRALTMSCGRRRTLIEYKASIRWRREDKATPLKAKAELSAGNLLVTVVFAWHGMTSEILGRLG